MLQELDFLASDYKHLVPPERLNSGALALFWKQDVNLQILSSSKNVIDTIISFKWSTFFATFVYGNLEAPLRYIVWDFLISLSVSRNSSWIFAGDFNEIIDNSEKSGGPKRAEGSFGAFSNMLTSCDLFDLKHTGISLSWRGQRQHIFILQARQGPGKPSLVWLLLHGQMSLPKFRHIRSHTSAHSLRLGKTT